jgi:hypothetical protein
MTGLLNSVGSWSQTALQAQDLPAFLATLAIGGLDALGQS